MARHPSFMAIGAAILLVQSCALASAGNATSADGQWIAQVPPKPYCSPSRLTLNVSRGVIAGYVVNSEGSFPVVGEIDRTGMGVIRILQVAGVIRFVGDRFVADYPNLRCGLRHAVGFRSR
jgi:hypothetical protein